MSEETIKFEINNLSKETRRFVDEIQEEPDRSVPIVAVAFLDEVIKKLLAAYFVNDNKVVKRTLEYPGTLSYFAARVDIAYCLGLIPPKAYQDIAKIKKIRNEFSHSRHTVTFNNKETSDICKTLYFSMLVHTSHSYNPSPRDQFIITAIMLVNTILLKASSVEHVKKAKDYTIGQIVKA